MSFDFLNPLNSEPIELTEYLKEDFTEEELEIIKCFCDSLINNISYNDRHLLFEKKNKPNRIYNIIDFLNFIDYSHNNITKKELE